MIALMTVFLPKAGQAQDFRLYVNARFGSNALVPTNWQALPPPENGDGLKFVSPDGRANMTISGAFIIDPPSVPLSPIQPSDEIQVTYAAHGNGWAVATGVKDDMIIYRKSLVSCHGTIQNDLDIEYPVSQKNAYDGAVSRVAASLAGGCGIYH